MMFPAFGEEEKQANKGNIERLLVVCDSRALCLKFPYFLSLAFSFLKLQ